MRRYMVTAYRQSFAPCWRRNVPYAAHDVENRQRASQWAGSLRCSCCCSASALQQKGKPTVPRLVGKRRVATRRRCVSPGGYETRQYARSLTGASCSPCAPSLASSSRTRCLAPTRSQGRGAFFTPSLFFSHCIQAAGSYVRVRQRDRVPLHLLASALGLARLHQALEEAGGRGAGLACCARSKVRSPPSPPRTDPLSTSGR